MNKPRLKELEVLIGNWDWTLSNAWFLDSLETKVVGTASFEWIDKEELLLLSCVMLKNGCNSLHDGTPNLSQT